MDGRLRWMLGLLMSLFLVVTPIVYYRWDYSFGKRLRVVEPGQFYRSGQMTADGFRQAILTYGIKTVINAQDAFPDPDLHKTFFQRNTIKETEICRELGVRYVHLPPDLISRKQIPDHRPVAIDKYLAILDDPANYPVLVHCLAGLHRTGVLTAVYRMEYQGWDRPQALDELRANGFGLWDSTAANDYITQYILTYRRGVRETPAWTRR